MEVFHEEIPEMESMDRSGFLSVFLIPLAALLIIVITVFAFGFAASRGTGTALDRNFPYVSLESPILREAMEDIRSKRAELDKKDVQIRRYQDRILDMDNNLRILQDLMQDRLRTREDEFLEEMKTIIGEERARLVSLGKSDIEVNRALERLRSDLDSDYGDMLDEFRSRELQDYRNRLENSRLEREALQTALAAAVEERRALAQTLEDDREELLVRLHEEKEHLNLEKEGAEADLEVLRESRRTENYWLDELANQYLGLLEALSVRDVAAARMHIDALESLFFEERIAALPGMEARNEADRELVRFFSAYILTLGTADREAFLAESRMLIEQAAAHQDAGRYSEAEMAWDNLAKLWPLMETAMDGSLETRDALLADDLARFSEIALNHLDSGNHRRASTVWEQALEQIPDPMGEELRSWWNAWVASSEQRIAYNEQAAVEVLAAERNASEVRYNELADIEAAKRRILQDRYGELSAELETIRSEKDDLAVLLAEERSESREASTDEELAEAKQTISSQQDSISSLERRLEELRIRNGELADARTLIAVLEERIADLEGQLERTRTTPEPPDVPAAAAQWRLYGTIVQVIGSTLVIEPRSETVPAQGSELRVMRSLGEDRVIHLADGIILEAGSSRAVGSLLSGTSGAEVYGSPETDDLVYISSP